MHDAKGRPLQVGDRVLIPATVTHLHGGDEYCNVNATSALGRKPDGQAETFSAINTGVMLRANDGDENADPFAKIEPAAAVEDAKKEG